MPTVGSGITFEKYGFDELEAKLRLLVSKVPSKGTPETLTGGAEIIKTEVQKRAHVITGFMRDSVKVEPGTPGSLYSEAGVVAEAHYSVFEEYGTRFRPAHPWFRPGVQAAQNRVALHCKENLEQLIIEYSS